MYIFLINIIIMGNTLRIEKSEPKSLFDCMDNDGNIDSDKLMLLQRQRRQKRMRASEKQLIDSIASATEEIERQQQKKARARRSVKRHPVYIRDDNGNIVRLTPTKSSWYAMYVLSPNINNEKWKKKFRRRFRMPYEKYVDVVEELKEAEAFKQWSRFDAVGSPPSPIELLVLGALRYIGRGWTFDDLEESTGISEETHRKFFHVFITYGSTIWYERYVRWPSTAAEAEEHMHEMALAGFDGCVGSMDATHVGMERCQTSTLR